MKVLEKYINIGNRTTYEVWESDLTRKLNLMALIGVVNVFITALFFHYFKFHTFLWECYIVIVIAPLVVVFNKCKNYIWSAYLFNVIGFVMFYSLASKMGIDSYSILYFFPLIISIVQMFGRKRLMLHMLLLLSLCFMTMLAVAYNYKMNYLEIEIDNSKIKNLKIFNIIITFITSSAFMFIVTHENINKETMITNMLKEKDILLSEVFHRVKNNMNIITSLLNLQKETSGSQETKNALEESRNRVFSMALVHQKIYQNSNLNHINFKEYVNDLTNELCGSFGHNIIEKELNLENVELDISYAIPCGLIINELITNSFKYGRKKDQKLKITLKLFKKNDDVHLIIQDNGPGVEDFERLDRDSLGLFLVKSLCEQIEAKYTFRNSPGCEFELSFKQKKN